MKEEKDEKLIDRLARLLDIVICLILCIMSLYKGGFYKADTAFSNLAIGMFGVVIIIIKLIRNIRNNGMVKKSTLISILDALMIVMPVCYLLPIMFKTYANIEGSITEFLTYMNFSIIYFIVRSTKNKNYYISTIIIIGVILAILGIDELNGRQLENIVSTMAVSYSSTYTGRLAATLQYANVTAVLLLLASQFSIYRLIDTQKMENNIDTKYKKILYEFIIILLNTSVILTSSRMASIIMGISYLSIYVYSVLKKNRSLGVNIIILLFSSIIFSNIIENNVINNKNSMVILMFVLLFILIYIFEKVLNTEKTKKIIARILSKCSLNKKRKYITLTCKIIIIVLFMACVVFINSDLNISEDEGKNVQGRNIYEGFEIGKNEVTLNMECNEITDYRVYIYEIYDDFSRSTLANINNFQITKAGNDKVTLHTSINVSEKAKNLRISFTVNDGSISIQSLKLNNKDIRLSYALIPDSLVFKLKDTIYHDQNNDLRKEYYKDSIKLIKSSHIVGIGGEGFLARYQEIQETGYISSEAHSNILQIGVETGIVGITIFVAIMLITILLLLKGIKIKENKEYSFVILITFLSYIVIAMFDITMSFELLVLVLALIIGLGVNETFDSFKEKNINIYRVDNKSILSLIKICVLTTTLMIVGTSTYYSYNVYRASMINITENNFEQVPEKIIENSYSNIITYENKVKRDKFNVKYIMKLSELYSEHIKLLTKYGITEMNSKTKEKLEKDSIVYTIKQKDIVDNLIEYDYYNKYVLNVAAENYFDNFLAYSEIYKENFKTTEVAYAFYLGYAMNLTERIKEIGKYNKVADEGVKAIYEKYYKELSVKNTYLKSEVVESVIKDIGKKLAK